MKGSQTQEYRMNGNTYTKVLDPGRKTYRFFVNGTEIDVYAWNRVGNQVHPMCQKADHPSPLIRWIERHRWRLIRHHVKANGSRLIVDLGCESGNISSVLSFSGSRVVLLDVDPSMLASIERDSRRQGISCLAADIYKIPLADGTVDRVVCTEVLEHLVDPAGAVREIYRILKPGGRTVVSVPNERLVLLAKRTLLRMGLKRLLGNLSPGLAMGHLRIFDKVSLVSLFRSEGFRTLRCFYNRPYFTNLFLVGQKS